MTDLKLLIKQHKELMDELKKNPLYKHHERSFKRIILSSQVKQGKQFFKSKARLLFPNHQLNDSQINLCQCTKRLATIGSEELGEPQTGGEMDRSGGSHTDHFIDMTLYEVVLSNAYQNDYINFLKHKQDDEKRTHNIQIFVLDTGIHQNVYNRITEEKFSLEIIEENCIRNPSSLNNHGSAVASELIIALKHLNKIKIHDYDVSSTLHDGRTVIAASKVACALQDILLNKATDDIIYINLSLGFEIMLTTIRDLLLEIIYKFPKSYIFCSAGNNGFNLKEKINFPSLLQTYSQFDNRVFEIYGYMENRSTKEIWRYETFKSNTRNVSPHIDGINWQDAVIYNDPNNDKFGGTSIATPRALAFHINEELFLSS